MEVISLSKALQTLKKIQNLDQNIVAPLAEGHFKTIDERLDWLESQADKMITENNQQVDLTLGTFTNTEIKNNKLQLKLLKTETW